MKTKLLILLFVVLGLIGTVLYFMNALTYGGIFRWDFWIVN